MVMVLGEVFIELEAGELVAGSDAPNQPDALQIDQVPVGGAPRQFGELGGDSLAAVGVIAELNSKLNCDLTVVEFYDKPTARSAALSIAITNNCQASRQQDQSTAGEESKRALLRELYLGSRKAARKN